MCSATLETSLHHPKHSNSGSFSRKQSVMQRIHTCTHICTRGIHPLTYTEPSLWSYLIPVAFVKEFSFATEARRGGLIDSSLPLLSQLENLGISKSRAQQEVAPRVVGMISDLWPSPDKQGRCQAEVPQLQYSRVHFQWN